MEDEKKKDLTQEGVVLKTTDYGIFNYIESNRTVSKTHVQHLINSFEANPHLVQTRPILVNEKMEVIDGQHRLQACMTLRLPVYYMVAKGTDVESAQLMNALQRGWSLIDFARSYALNANDPAKAKTYKTFLQLFEEYKVPVTLLIVCCEQRTRHNNTQSFKRGELLIKDVEKTRLWLNMIEEVNELVTRDVSGRYAFIHALVTVFKNEQYNHERFVQKLKETRLEPQLDRSMYLREIERIYNHKFNEENKVRFF